MTLIKGALGGVDIYPVHPTLHLFTDDSNVFVFEGLEERQLPALGCTNHGGSVRGYFVVDGGGHKNDLRVRHTFSMSAGGFLAPIFVSVTGLTEAELPSATCLDSLLIVQVAGLAVGSAVDPRNKHIGYVAFIRGRPDGAAPGSETPEMACYRDYRQNVFLPWVQELRETISP